MVPKIIHYCWFGGNPFPEILKEYISTWKKKCPDYEIIEWNENNFNVEEYQYSKEAYENKQWAFVADVARLHVLYNYGGIYLDTDVEVLRTFDELLHLKGFIGAEDKYDLNTGAIVGSQKEHPIILENLMEYKHLPLFINQKINKITCVELTTRVLIRHGYKNAKKVKTFAEMTVFPMEYFSPLKLHNNKLKVTENTYSIHHYSTHWKKRSELQKILTRRTVVLKKALRRNIDYIFGEGVYTKLKHKFKR